MGENTFRAAVVACLDVGSPKKGNVGWAVIHEQKETAGQELGDFVREISTHLRKGRSIAVGFECPLYVPKRADIAKMTNCRLGEQVLNWCGGPGASVLATGLAQVNWVLTQLAALNKNTTGTTRWPEFVSGRCRLFFWEAFITSRAGVVVNADCINGVSPHVADALCGALAFQEVTPTNGAQFPSDLQDEPALSLIGMHLLETGLSTDMSLMSECCAVLKVKKPKFNTE